MKKLLYNLCSILLMFFLILFSVFTVVNTLDFYTDQYEKNSTEHATGMSARDLERATVMLLDYLNDKRDDLDMQAREFGIMSETFDEREKTHMVDVKALYRNAAITMCLFFCISAAGFVYLAVKDRNAFRENLSKGFRTALYTGIVLCIAFGLAFTLGFDTFWTLFHKVVFTNDLWLLDPRISTMINMFPLNFFLAMCSKILLRFAVLFLACRAVINTVKKRARRKAKV